MLILTWTERNVESKGALNAYLDMTFIRQNYWKQNLVNVSQNILFPMMRLFIN
jgi:hypothetical protein